jgi:hypothetical protein
MHAFMKLEKLPPIIALVAYFTIIDALLGAKTLKIAISIPMVPRISI